jgi:hypothetical protein
MQNSEIRGREDLTIRSIIKIGGGGELPIHSVARYVNIQKFWICPC